MKSKLLLAIAISALGLTATAQDYKLLPQEKMVLDTSAGVAMLKQCSRSVPKNVQGFWQIEKQDLDILLNNFKKLYQISATEGEHKKKKVDDLDLFGYQFIGFIIDNKRHIYINAYVLERGKEELQYQSNGKGANVLSVCDGGVNYWGALFDLERKGFSQLVFNRES
jgi:hypothetical protein